MIPAIAFVGRSGSGKTTFLEKLIPVLTGRGYRVGAVKHAHHVVEVDRPGKDSFRLREAGASEVVLSARGQLAVIHTVEERVSLEVVLGYFKEVDLILVEGFKDAGLPSIEIYRAAAGTEEPLFLQGSHPLALVSDRAFPRVDFPVFPLDDVAGVADLVERKILQKKRRPS